MDKINLTISLRRWFSHYSLCLSILGCESPLKFTLLLSFSLFRTSKSFVSLSLISGSDCYYSPSISQERLILVCMLYIFTRTHTYYWRMEKKSPPTSGLSQFSHSIFPKISLSQRNIWYGKSFVKCGFISHTPNAITLLFLTPRICRKIVFEAFGWVLQKWLKKVSLMDIFQLLLKMMEKHPSCVEYSSSWFWC